MTTLALKEHIVMACGASARQFLNNITGSVGVNCSRSDLHIANESVAVSRAGLHSCMHR